VVTILIHAEIHGLAGRVTDLRVLLGAHAQATSRAPGSAGATAAETLGGEAGEFVLVAWWDDEASLRAHYATDEYARYAAAVSELIARPSDVTVHEIERSVRARADLSLDPTRQD
jgi:quinol monooxygenase YgiN